MGKLLFGMTSEGILIHEVVEPTDVLANLAIGKGCGIGASGSRDCSTRVWSYCLLIVCLLFAYCLLIVCLLFAYCLLNI